MISQTSVCVIGTCSDGLRMNVLPQAIANGRNHIGTIAGKLNGTIAAQTPTGWRIVSQSTAVATPSRMRPCIVVGIAVAHSIISIIRAVSACASGKVLPISRVIEAAMSSLRSCSAWRSVKSQRARSITDLERQVSNASRAAATACSSSSFVDSGTRARTSPVAGLVTSSCSVEADGTHLPPM